jgi:hypothetical protein
MLDEAKLIADIKHIISYAHLCYPQYMSNEIARAFAGANPYSQLQRYLYEGYAKDKYHKYDIVVLEPSILKKTTQIYAEQLAFAINDLYKDYTKGTIKLFKAGRWIHVRNPLPPSSKIIYRVYVQPKLTCMQQAIVQIAATLQYHSFKFVNPHEGTEFDFLRSDRIVMYISTPQQLQNIVAFTKSHPEWFNESCQTQHFTRQVTQGVGVAPNIEPQAVKDLVGFIPTDSSFGDQFCRMLAFGLVKWLQTIKDKALIEQITHSNAQTIGNLILGSAVLRECRKIQSWAIYEQEFEMINQIIKSV